MVARVLLLALLSGVTVTRAQSQEISPVRTSKPFGVPPIPASLAREVDPYTRIYGLQVAGWDPQKREVWLKVLSNATWVSHVHSPGSPPELSSIFIRSDGIYDIYFQPQSKYLAYTKDTDGDESFQLYIYEIAGGKITQLSNGKSRNTEPVLVQCR